jgi:hypothetical protein
MNTVQIDEWIIDFIDIDDPKQIEWCTTIIGTLIKNHCDCPETIKLSYAELIQTTPDIELENGIIQDGEMEWEYTHLEIFFEWMGMSIRVTKTIDNGL